MEDGYNLFMKVAELGIVFAILVAIILVLIYFIRYLLREAKEERTLTRKAFEANTVVLTKIEAKLDAINR